MIEGYFREKLQAAYPQLVWSENNYEDPDNTGTIYKEAGAAPDTYETGLRFPNYMVWVRSSNRDLAQSAAEGSVEIMNKLHREEFTNYEGVTYEIIFVEAIGEANRIGMNEGVMEWNANFKVTLRRKN
jgi:hypothetical protein